LPWAVACGMVDSTRSVERGRRWPGAGCWFGGGIALAGLTISVDGPPGFPAIGQPLLAAAVAGCVAALVVALPPDV
jgi:hypothetical protein